eukprot:2593092-Amphidinium_carterae.1
MEIIVELDGRWATVQTLEQVVSSWKSTAVHMLGQRAATTVTSADLYACMPVEGSPYPLWRGKARLTPKAGLKALAASGLDALFLRPADPACLSRAA